MLITCLSRQLCHYVFPTCYFLTTFEHILFKTESSKINTICLPLDKSKAFNYQEENFHGQYDAIIAGWGYTTKHGQGGNI